MKLARSLAHRISIAAAAIALLSAAPASAAPAHFELSGAYTGGFDFSANFGTAGTPPDAYGIYTYANGTGSFTEGIFALLPTTQTLKPGETFAFSDTNTGAFGEFFGSVDLFTGPIAAPNILNGTYSLVGASKNIASSAFTLTITNGSSPGAPAPELGTGLVASLLTLAALTFTRPRRPAAGLDRDWQLSDQGLASSGV